MFDAGRLLFDLTAVLLHGLPDPVLQIMIDGCAALFYLTSPGRRARVRRNLAGIGHPTRARDVFGIFHTHTANIFDMFVASREKQTGGDARITMVGRELLDEALAGGHGVIMATVHVGNWERAAVHLSGLGYRLFVVAGIQMNRLLTGSIRSEKETRGIGVITPENSYRPIFGALRSGGVVALLLDGDLYQKGIPVTFFGRRTPMPRGAVQLCRRTGAPVLAGFCRRLGPGSYRIEILQVFDCGQARAMTEEEALTKLYGVMAGIISRNGDQWCIFRDFWGNAL